ncbi:MAG: hypothetical protein N2253_06395 [Bacteroidia bacterium]|nr:hypothetical protein [Bacteroidia bacterium]MCX7764501.1 hypothetical protein [Bacteroidia bacterium]MDW8056969.1 hypothetical protein [Bacteroidia bacterium]
MRWGIVLLATAWAQGLLEGPAGDLWAKINPFFGAELSFIDIRFLTTPLFANSPDFWGLTLGSNYTYFRTENEVLAAGPGAQITGSFQFLGRSGTNWMVQVPVYAYARMGAGATAYNTQRLGIGVGAGLRFTTFQLTYTSISGNYVGKLRQSFVNPTVFVDITLNFRRTNPTTLRGYFDILSSRRNTELMGSIDPVPLEFRTFGVGILYPIGR